MKPPHHSTSLSYSLPPRIVLNDNTPFGATALPACQPP